MIDYIWAEKKFTDLYGDMPRIFRAPGRVNLIGEHTDYNDGFVLPMAIDRESVVAISPRRDRKIRAYTFNLEETAEVNLNEECKHKNGFWLNYVEGVARILDRNFVKVSGANMLICSNVPTGAGLSSSAALEMAVGFALSEISGKTIDLIDLAKVGQQTEHEFVGANVGIMDQFVSAHARKNHALLLDCRSLKYENLPLNTEEIAIVMCDTNIKHDLASSAYNTRRKECETAVKILKEFLPEIENLRDVKIDEFEKFSDKLPDTIYRRARHIITENERTCRAAECLKNNNLCEFGKLMWQSHESLKNDYEVSCKELDLMIEIAKKAEGVLGARMTGGGFGGSTVNLVKIENLGKFKETVRMEYRQKTNIKPTILVSDANDGVSEITVGYA